MIGFTRLVKRIIGCAFFRLVSTRPDRQRRRLIVYAVCCAAALQATPAICDSSRVSANSTAVRQSSKFQVKALHKSTKDSSQFVQGEWPFRRLVQPTVPTNAPQDPQIENPIDTFVNQKLKAAQLKMNAPADKLTLLRRVTFDLTGLPPTRAEQESFIADTSATAYAKVVDRLLASPRYGEQWAQHWLDLARYGESDGFKTDHIRPDAFRYRDYVIRSFNQDLPYDQFVREQLAGDELVPDNRDALVATGFLRLYPEDVNASNLVQQRQEILDDITDNAGLIFLGLTVGCARCHDHKFDPITQADYYRLQACFASILPKDATSIATAEEIKSYHKKMGVWERLTKPIQDKIDQELSDEREAVLEDAIAAYDPETLQAIKTPAKKRTCLQEQLVAETEEWVQSRLERAYRRCPPDERKLFDQQTIEIAKYDPLKPAPLPTAMTMSDGDGDAPRTCILKNGNYQKPGTEVRPGFPEFLGASEPQFGPKASVAGSVARRAALAEWLVRPDHPLTVRVLVNRLWQYHFGQGIVATTNDFGVMGGNPSHQELLDWLAAELVSNGWHIKPIQRLIVLSAAYCQSSTVDPSTATYKTAIVADPSNNLLWHARRQRLEGETLRDAMLDAAGRLNLKMYGPSVHPALPDVLADTRYGWDEDKNPADRCRRSIYVLARRNMRLPLLEAFDQPDRLNSCPRRTATTTAPQALEMLNGQVVEGLARQWSGKLLAECGSDSQKLIRRAFIDAYARTPSDNEIRSAESFLEKQSEVVEGDGVIEDGQLPIPVPNNLDRAKAAATVDFCHAIFCSNEFMYVD